MTGTEQRKKMKTHRKSWRSVFASIFKYILLVLICILLAVAISGKYAARWYKKTFGVTIREIIYTMNSPLKGADTGFLGKAVSYCMPGIILSAVLIAMILVWEIAVVRRVRIHWNLGLRGHRKVSINLTYVRRGITLALAIAMVISTFSYVDRTLKISDYIDSVAHQTKIYENEYVDPNDVDITVQSGQKKNLIYIYMESMETTYAPKADGGYQPVNNYMPNLTELASQNINFTNKMDGRLGGWHSLDGTGWTMGALFSTTSGVPFSFSTDGNTMNERKKFASGITTLGDILEKQGYNQEFLCGSDAEFAGRKEYFHQHGNYKVFDYNTAVEKGYIPEGRVVWWGFEDEYLYQIARDEVTQLASENKPFNLTMLTVDTHHVDGYVCDLCENQYPEQLANVVSCADRQAYDFVQWCEAQPFFANTQIIISGDHPRMDNDLVDGVSYYDRTVYNCFISADETKQANTEGREFAAMDMFPSILSFLGYDIHGDRLGLGTNLFSNKKTLMEQYGYKKLSKELSRYSQYYIDKFS